MSKPQLGAIASKDGTQFSLFSAHATGVTLCLFDTAGAETDRIALSRNGNVWSGRLPDVSEGQLYGYRVDGPYTPQEGHRFNVNKLLIDPYAKALSGQITEHPALYGHLGDDDLSFNPEDSTDYMPKSVVTAATKTRQWSRVNTSWSDTIIYEAHVKGFTRTHPSIAKNIRGTADALADPAIIDHLTSLGVTAIELLPLQQFHSEARLTKLGLTNYWGYNPINYFSPHAAYLGPDGEDGLRRSIEALHAAGIEVILDVVYNHTAESWHLGPTLSYKGIDNQSYYALQKDRRYYLNHTGTGNMLDMRSSAVRELTLDSLRHWVNDFGIDGFRFDLAPTLGRQGLGFDNAAPMFGAIANDPVLSSIKLIAEPWDIGPGGYQLGQFPNGWAEWNDEYRDTARSFWRSDDFAHKSLAAKILGSAETFDHSRRPSWSSVNFLSAHDGFTLHDTVSYARKHNDANSEDNRDGHGHNLSDNLGVEGPSDDPSVNDARRKRKTAMFATLLFSQGTPMLLAGDEFGQTQGGNNNAYCQDNETSWLNWRAADIVLQDQVRELIAIRKRYPHFRQDHFLHGEITKGLGVPNVQWIMPEGRLMTDQDWERPDLPCFGIAFAMQDQPTLAIFLNRSGIKTINLSNKWKPILGDRNLEDECVAVFELPVGGVPDWELTNRLKIHADSNGLIPSFRDVSGHYHDMTDETRSAILQALEVDLSQTPQTKPNLEPHGLTVFGASELEQRGGVWGVTTALYALHSQSSWGMGDFDDLGRLAEILASTGCDFIGINPVLALFPSAPHLYAPYSVSSREFLNVMHIAPHCLPEWTGTRPKVNSGNFVDYEAVYQAKTKAFESAYAQFSRLAPEHPRRAEFEAYKAVQGDALKQHTLFDTLFENLPVDQQNYRGWKNFAPQFHGTESHANKEFAQTQSDRLNYYAYLQWNAALQLSEAQARAKAAGMSVGLFLDIPVGVTEGSSDVWRNREAFAHGVSLGAPGDAANPAGQRWNLLPLRPDKFGPGEAAEQLFRKALNTTLSFAGAARIDHVLGLMRSFWIPNEAPGGYVSYPFERLVDIIAEESRGCNCIIFGEDLGTVPDGFRDRLAARDMMGCSVQMVERGQDGEILPREASRNLAMTAWSNHDFPTVAGFWTSQDLEWRSQLGIGLETLDWDHRRRQADIKAIADLVGLSGVPDELSSADMAQLQSYLAGGPSLAFAVQLDDLLLSQDQPNVPGTTAEQPNWRRRVRLSLEQLQESSDIRSICSAIDLARSRAKSNL